MPMDTNQFLQVFIEESLEAMQEIEQTLLNIELDDVDIEKINSLFRSIHSMKSSSAVLGFKSMSELAHTLETFLDFVRSNVYQLNQQDIDLLLEAVDILRLMLNSAKNNTPINEEETQRVVSIFKSKNENIYSEIPEKKKKPEAESGVREETKKDQKVEKKKEERKEEKKETPVAAAVDKKNEAGWRIQFHPNRNILQTGTDPSRAMGVLKELGKMEVEVDTSSLPPFPEFNPEECFLIWNIVLYTSTPENEIREVFIWVANDESVVVVPVSEQISPVKSVKKETAVPAEKKPAAMKEPVAQLEHITSVRVTTEKIDNILNIVGELVIAQSVINQIAKDFEMSLSERLYEGLGYLDHNFRELQANVMRVRMVPVEYIFSRIPRFIHDLASKMDKQVDLITKGGQTELDKNMLEKISDPILHLVRNAVDHGIERSEVRQEKGKSAKGIIKINAHQESGNIIIDVSDDGGGLNRDRIRAKAIERGLISESDQLTDEEMFQLIFQPGFSTAAVITDISGRGVGLDVVYKNVRDVGGDITIESVEGEGSTFRMRLPLTLAIMDCQLIRIGEETYIIPLVTITEIIKIDPGQLNYVDQNNMIYHFRNEYIPIIQLSLFFNIPDPTAEMKNKFLIVVDVNEQYVGLIIDELLSQQQVVIKNLEDNYQKITGISGATILGNGRVALILDVTAIVEYKLSSASLIQNFGISISDQNIVIEEEQSEIEDNSKPVQFLSFLMAGQEYGIDILEVKEIRKWERGTYLPNSPHYIKGVINMRGVIVPIIDLRERFGIESCEQGPHTAIIILVMKLHHKQRYIGIVVDQIADTFMVVPAEIQPLPDSEKSVLKEHIRGLITFQNKLITLLNMKNLILVAIEQENAA